MINKVVQEKVRGNQVFCAHDFGNSDFVLIAYQNQPLNQG